MSQTRHTYRYRKLVLANDKAYLRSPKIAVNSHGSKVAFSQENEITFSRAQLVKLIEACKNDAMRCTDTWYATILRNFMVFSNVCANCSNNDADNPSSLFNQFVRGGEKFGNYTAAEWALGFGVIVPTILGIVTRYFIIKSELELQTEAYLQERLKAVFATHYPQRDAHAPNIDDIRTDLDSISAKIIGRYQGQLPHQGKNGHNRNAYFTPHKLKALATKLVNKQHPENQVIDAIRQKPIIKDLKAAFDKADEISGYYWYTWMAAVPVIGLTAIAAPTALLATSLIAISACAVFTAVMTIVSNTEHAEQNQQPETTKEKAQKHKEAIEQYANSVKHVRLLMKVDHRLYLAKLQAALDLFAQEQRLSATELQQLQASFPKIYGIKKYKSIADIKTETDIATVDDAFTQLTNFSNSKTKLSLITYMIKEMGMNATKVFFGLWLASAICGGLAFFPTIAAPMTAIVAIMNPVFALTVACTVAAIAGIAAYYDHKKQLAAYQIKKDSTATAAYKSNAQETASKQEALNVLRLRIEQLKSNILLAQETIRLNRHIHAALQHNVNSDARIAIEQAVLDLDISTTDINNDYIKTMLAQPSNFTVLANAFTLVKVFVEGFQSGVFNMRNVGLIGGVLGTSFAAAGTFLLGPVLGPIAAFIGTALAAGIIGGIINVTQYILQQKLAEKTSSLNNIDELLTHQRKKYFELDNAYKAYKLIAPADHDENAVPAPVGASSAHHSQRPMSAFASGRIFAVNNRRIDNVTNPSPQVAPAV